MARIEELPKVLLRVTDRKTAELFVKKGIIHFGRPKNWVEYYEKSGNNGIGDKLEGIFLRKSIIEKQPDFNKCIIKTKLDNGYINYWHPDVLDLPTMCFYGIGVNNIVNKGVKSLYHKQDIGYVETDYFKEFTNNTFYSKESFERIPKSKQKVVIIICEPVKLFNLIKENAKCGIIRDNINYVNKKNDFIAECEKPYELFFKDIDFEKQSEFRITLLNPNVDEVIVGDISSFCKIEEMYFERMDFAFQDDNKFLYKLPNPITENYYAKGFEELVTLFLVLADLDYPLQGKEINEYYYLINNSLPYFKKYGIKPYIEINEITNSFNIKYVFKDEKWKEEFYKISNNLHYYNDKHFHQIMLAKGEKAG